MARENRQAKLSIEEEMVRKSAVLLGVGLLGSVLLVSAAYLSVIHRAYARVRGHSNLLATPYGDIEYSEGGVGADVLVIHGSGGGYDQGELLAGSLLGDQFHHVTPSRFGYLRSTFHEGAVFDDQADAYVALLDHLGIHRVAVVAFSAGGPSAQLLAVLHPERVSSLTLVSCATIGAPESEAAHKQADEQGRMLLQIVKYDLPYWLITGLFAKQFMGLMGANETTVSGLSTDQRQVIEQYIEYMNPASRRAMGAAFDYQARIRETQIAEIHVPTLVIHAKDDTLQPYYNAAFASNAIPGAQLMHFDNGGHLIFAKEQRAINAAVQKHVLAHAEERPRQDQ